MGGYAHVRALYGKQNYHLLERKERTECCVYCAPAGYSLLSLKCTCACMHGTYTSEIITAKQGRAGPGHIGDMAARVMTRTSFSFAESAQEVLGSAKYRHIHVSEPDIFCADVRAALYGVNRYQVAAPQGWLTQLLSSKFGCLDSPKHSRTSLTHAA